MLVAGTPCSPTQSARRAADRLVPSWDSSWLIGITADPWVSADRRYFSRTSCRCSSEPREAKGRRRGDRDQCVPEPATTPLLLGDNCRRRAGNDIKFFIKFFI